VKKGGIFIVLDIMMAIAILSNLGALALTNVLVVKEMEEPIVYEANPITAKITEYSEPPVEHRKPIYLEFFKHIAKFIGLGIALGMYLWYRHLAVDKYTILRLCLCVGIWFTIIVSDFSNNFGIWIGVLLGS